MTNSSVLTGAVPALGRVLISAIFLISVAGKLAAPAATISYIASAHLPLPQGAYAIAVFVELFGGVALALGFRTRIAAAVLAVFCIAAALGFHSNFGDQNQFFHFLKNVAMAGGLLQVLAFGGGRFSLDARRASAHHGLALQ
jgi:putative oxidoreductase